MKALVNLKKINSSPTGQNGFTFIELILVIGILSLLLTIAYVNSTNIQVTAIKSNSINVLVSDIKKQQVKAMTGDTEGRGITDNYGIKIFSNRYIFFHGMQYSASSPDNFEVPVESGFVLSSTFPQNTLLFASNSGELVGFTQGQNTISITSASTNQSQTVQFNKYGTIISVNP